MDSKEKIGDMISIVEKNHEYVNNELTDLSAKVNSFLDDTTKMVSGELLFNMYIGLMLQTEKQDG